MHFTVSLLLFDHIIASIQYHSSGNDISIYHISGRSVAPCLGDLSWLFDSRGPIGKSEGSPEPIAKGKDLSIVVNVMGVVNGMVLTAHDGVNVPIHGIVDVGCPYGGEKDHAQMGQVVARNEWQEVDVGTGLQDSIDWVEGNRSPGCEGLGLVVIVVLQVNVLVENFVGVEGAVHPVDSDFDAEKVKDHGRNVLLPSSNFVNGEVNLCVIILDEEFIKDWKHSVNDQRGLGQLYLSLDGLPGGSCSSLGLKDLLGLGVDVAKVVEYTGGSIVYKASGNEISQVAKKIVRPLEVVTEFMDEPGSKASGKEERIDPGIEISAWVSQWVVV